MISFFKTKIIIIILFEFINTQSLCEFNDCFNCSLCGTEQICNCEWSPINKVCRTDRVKLPFNYNYDYFFSCYDDNSLRIQKYYCGNSNIKLNDQNTAEINMIENKGKYGAQNLFCEYIYDQATVSSNINYNILITISPLVIDYIKISLSIINNDNKIDRKNINYKFEENYKNVKKIKIQIYFEQQLSSNPFSIKIIKKESKNNYKIYISIGIILLACIICGIIIYCVSKKASENARMRQEMYLRMARASQRRRLEENFSRLPPSSSRDPSSSSESEISIQEINTKKIENLLKTILSPIKYYKHLGDKDGNPCTVCTICIEEFKVDKSKVSITPCQHIFHYECLRDWLMKNVLNPKCPNCNYNLLQELEKNECICSQGLYDIPELAISVKRSNEHKQTNVEGRDNYNDHNNTINMGENGMETGENRFITRNVNRRYDNICMRSIEIMNVNVNKNENKSKNNNKVETSANKEDEIDEVVIENIDGTEIGN